MGAMLRMQVLGLFAGMTVSLSSMASAQTATPYPGVVSTPALSPAMAPATPAGTEVSLAEPLAALKQVLLKVNESLVKTHPQKWKVKGDEHEADQRNYLSIHEDMEEVLPGLLKTAQANPHSLSSGLAVYRNVNALYDVLVRLQQTAVIAGKDDAAELQDAVSRVETLRGLLGEKMMALSVQQETRIADAQRVLDAQAAAPPKHIVADDAPSRKKSAKKAGAKPAGSKAGSTAAAGSASANTKPAAR